MNNFLPIIIDKLVFYVQNKLLYDITIAKMSEITNEKVRLEAAKLILNGKTLDETELGEEIRGRVKELFVRTAGIDVTCQSKTDNAVDVKAVQVALPAEAKEFAENPELAKHHQEYRRLSKTIKSLATWETIIQRLLANNSEKLKLVQAMMGRGQLVGIDAEGRALFKDRGVEPVMFGYDSEGKMMKIYDRDPVQMAKVAKWADYNEIRAQVQKDGYELFADNGGFGHSDEMKQVVKHTKEPFVASKDRKEWRASWLESGDKPDDARRVNFRPDGGRVRVRGINPEYRDGRYGAVRLLRV